MKEPKPATPEQIRRNVRQWRIQNGLEKPAPKRLKGNINNTLSGAFQAFQDAHLGKRKD